METLTVGKFLEILGRNSAEAGVLVLLVLMAQWLLGKRLRPRWRSGLWLLVMLRLLLPVSVGSTASLFNAFPVWKNSQPPISPAVPTTRETGPIVAPNSPQAPPYSAPKAATVSPARPEMAPDRESEYPPTALQPASSLNVESIQRVPPARDLNWTKIFFVVWVAGVLFLGFYVIFSSLRMTRRFSKLEPLTNPGLLALLRECRERFNIRSHIRISECAEIATPAMYGCFKPRLLLPRGFTDRFSANELRFILLHELAHVKRRDILFNWMAAILQVVHWFNPLIWLGFSRWRADRELACDALALETTGGEHNKEYGQTILRLLETFSHHSAVPGLVGILENKKQLQQRIRMIAGFRPGKKLGLVSAAVFAGLALVCLTDAQVPKFQTHSVTRTTANHAVMHTNNPSYGADPLPMANGTNLPAKTLAVKVIDAESGQPIADAEVSAPYIGDWNKPQPKRLTDAQGRYILEIPNPPKIARRQMAVFTVSASHPGYAERAVVWTSSGGNVESDLPLDTTIKLERGITIGGSVHDAGGAPIVGACVLLSGSGYSGFSLGTGERKSQTYSEIFIQDRKHPAAVTDKNGHWTYPNFPGDLYAFNVTFIRPDDSRYDYSTSPETPGLNQFPPISPDDLRGANASVVLPAGISVRGVVVDETGQPVAGAKVVEGYGYANAVRVSEFKTDVDGRFVRLNRAPRQWIYTASANGRATASVIAQVESNMPDVRIVLSPSRPLRIHITDHKDHPLANVDIHVVPYRTEGQLLDWNATTDANGNAIWSNAPAANVTLDAISESGVREFNASAGEDKVIVLSKDIGTRATVDVAAYDAKTKLPITIQSVDAQYNGDFSFKTLAKPDTTNASVEIKDTDFRVGMLPSYKIQVQANGYAPFVSDFIALSEGDQNLVLPMLRVQDADGTAWLPDGKLAAGARIWVKQDQSSGALFCNAPGRYYGDRLAHATVGVTGNFTLPAFDGNPPVIFTSPDGFLETKLADIQKTHQVRLQPWGKIDGVLKIAGKPEGDIRVSLSTLLWFPSLGFQLIYDTTTAPDGSFVFTNVPAGEYKLYRAPNLRTGRPITEDHQMPVTVQAGETTTVEYSNVGRKIIGQAEPGKPELAVDWLNDDDTLTLKQPVIPALNYVDYASSKAFQEAEDNAYKSPERLNAARDARTYVLQFDQDGSFHADDVPPGTYEMQILVTKPDPNNQFNSFNHPADVLGSLNRQFVVPPGAGPFDLGTLTVPMRGDGQHLKPVPFVAQSLDGNPISLEQFRGKYVLLAFWSVWSERSVSQLADFQKVQAEFAGDHRIVFLGADLNDDPDAVRKAVDAHGFSWTQTRLDASELVKTAAAFDVSKLPAIYLINPKGEVIDRDIEGDHLRLAVKRFLKD